LLKVFMKPSYAPGQSAATGGEQMQKLLKRKEVPDYLEQTHGVRYSTSTLGRLACSGDGPTFRRIGRHTFYAAADLDLWIESKTSPPLQRTSDFPIDGRDPKPTAEAGTRRAGRARLKNKTPEPDLFEPDTCA
jgi:hypothetical protein